MESCASWRHAAAAGVDGQLTSPAAAGAAVVFYQTDIYLLHRAQADFSAQPMMHETRL
jgi:hypothetical protein